MLALKLKLILLNNYKMRVLIILILILISAISAEYVYSPSDAQIELCWPNKQLNIALGKFVVANEDLHFIRSEYKIIETFPSLEKTEYFDYSIIELIPKTENIIFYGNDPISTFPLLEINRVIVPNQVIASCKRTHIIECMNLLEDNKLDYYYHSYGIFTIVLANNMSPCTIIHDLELYVMWDYADVVPYIKVFR